VKRELLERLLAEFTQREDAQFTGRMQLTVEWNQGGISRLRLDEVQTTAVYHRPLATLRHLLLLARDEWEVLTNADAFTALSSLGPRSEGRVFKVSDPRQSYRHAVRRAKLDDVTFHTLRHTFASWAMMRGASLKELQELLGYASLTMTMRYAHLAPERLKQAVSRLDGLTSGVKPSPLRLVAGASSGA
jgi:integrase